MKNKNMKIYLAGSILRVVGDPGNSHLDYKEMLEKMVNMELI